MDLLTIAFFVGFGLLVGILFGFFGMGGSFLVTPALLVLGVPVPVAVGSGLAFVFGTAVISALRHRSLGQVDYPLAGLMAVGTTIGIAIGSRALLRLVRLGTADLVVGWMYVGLLAVVGLFVYRDSRTRPAEARPGRIAAEVQALQVPPMVTLKGGVTVSVWVILAAGVGIGFLCGFLGIGGGFLLLPVMIYGFGVPTAIAVGTDILQIGLSSAFGTFIYAHANAVDLAIVTALLGGSAFGARIGANATRLVDAGEIKAYLAVMLLAGSAAVASRQVGETYGIALLESASAILIIGAVCLVSGAIIHASIEAILKHRKQAPPMTH